MVAKIISVLRVLFGLLALLAIYMAWFESDPAGWSIGVPCLIIFLLLGIPARRTKKRKEEERVKEEERLKVEAQKEKDKQQATQARLKIKLENLVITYGEEFRDSIMSFSLKLDMPEKLVDELFGQPEDTHESVTKTKTKKTNYYQPEKGSRGAVTYQLEVKLENGIVTGWKER